MKVTVDSKKGLKTDLKVIIDKKTINDQMNVRFEELKKTINLKGFRPGKVPVEILKKQFGKIVYGEILEKVLKDSSAKVLEEKKIKVAGQPKIDVKSHGEDKNLEYTIHVEQLPEIKVNKIETLKVTKYEINVSEADVKKRIDEIAKNQNNFIDKKKNEASIKGDLIVFDFSGTVENNSFEGGDGKNAQIVLGQNSFIKGFDEQLAGVKKDQKKLVEVILPDNYPNKKYANKKAKFDCKILNIKKPEKIIVDDNFAKNLGAQNLTDLKKMINNQIQSQYKNTLDLINKKEILKQLESFKDFKIPDNLIEQEMSVITQEAKKENIDKERELYKNLAKNRIKVGLILNEYGEQNNLKVNEDDLKKEIQKQIQMMPNQSKEVVEYYQKNSSALSALRGRIYEDKIMELIKDKAKSTKKTISIKEADQIILNDNKKDIEKNDNKPKVAVKKRKDTRSSTKSK